MKIIYFLLLNALLNCVLWVYVVSWTSLLSIWIVDCNLSFSKQCLLRVVYFSFPVRPPKKSIFLLSSIEAPGLQVFITHQDLFCHFHNSSCKYLEKHIGNIIDLPFSQLLHVFEETYQKYHRSAIFTTRPCIYRNISGIPSICHFHSSCWK